ncbi:tail fiber protein [Serratia fonticola]|nr:tail fiber protein [Serratia fonticola]
MANGEFGLGGFLLEKQGWQGKGYNFSAETGQPCTTLFSYESSNVTGTTKPPAWLETAGWGMGFRWFRAAAAKNQTVDFLFSRNGRMGYRFYYNGKDYEFYTTGNKPTALEINALPSDGGNLTGIVKTSAEIQSTSQNNYRIISGGYGSFWRQDVTGLYLLLTAENDPYGSYSSLRPLRVDIKTGDLTFGESVTIGKTLRAAQVWDNNQRVYSPNNKPTAADVGALERTDFPVGIPQPWSTTTPPTGWLKCNGAAFDRAKYPLLAVAYPTGTLPDLRGEFVRGWDDGRGIDSGRGILGAQSDELRSHRHLKLNVDTSGVAYGLGAGNFSNQQTGGFYANTSIGFDSGTPGIGTGPTGGAETRPRNIAFNYIVRAA